MVLFGSCRNYALMLVKNPRVYNIVIRKGQKQGRCEGWPVVWNNMGFDEEDNMWMWMFMEGPNKGQVIENKETVK